jgi:hypothetical protein
MKKYELLLVSKTIQKLRDMNEILLFLNELLNKVSKDEFFITYELTLLTYNICLNTFHDYSYFFDKEMNNKIKQLTICILQQLYDNTLNEEHISKITNDITYIQKYKQYTYISDVFMYTYFFFL